MAKIPIILIGGAVLWTGACLALWRFQEKLIFFPSSVPPDIVRNLAAHQITITADDGVTLYGWQHPAAETVAGDSKTDCDLFLYFGGNNEEVSHHFTDNGERFSCLQWYINYRGYGQSGGNPSADALRADALRIYDEAVKYLKENNYPNPKICILGRSLGSHMAAYVAAERDVHKLIMVTPFDSAINVARGRYPIFPVRKMMRHPFDTLAEAAKVRAKTLFILAEHDNVTPVAGSHRLINAWQAPHRVRQLTNTTHQYIETAEYWQEIAMFMSANH